MLGCGIWNVEFGISEFECGIWNAECGMSDFESRISDFDEHLI